MNQRIAIIGGGTGGLCLAHGLKRAGLDVGVYERSRTRTERLQGYRVHINPHGSAALHECLPPEGWRRFIETTGRSGGAFGFVTGQLRELVVLDEPPAADPAAAHHSVSRISLHQVLSGGLEDVLNYDKEFERYEIGEKGVLCHFGDGTTAEADLVIGADGANSRVRRQFLPHAQRVDTGIVTIAGKYPLTPETRGVLPSRLISGPNLVVGPPGAGFFTAPHELAGDAVNDETAEVDAVHFDNTAGYLMWAYGAGPARFPARVSEMDGEALRELVSGRVRDWHPAFATMIEASPAGTVSRLPILTSIPVEPWETGPVTLLGDAIHSMTPFRGIGANTALRDAQLLYRKLITAGDDVPGAIAAYEREMREYSYRAVRDSKRSAEQFVSESRLSRSMMKGTMGLLGAVPPLKRLAFREHGNS